jgi:hypothetical protein
LADRRTGYFKEAGTPQQRREYVLEHLKLYRQKIASGIFDRQQEKKAAQARIVEWMREEMNEAAGIHGGPETKRGAQDVIKVASLVLTAVAAQEPELVKQAAFLADLAARSLNQKIALDVDQVAALTKTAGPVEPHRIAPFLSTPDSPVQIINGNHRLFMDLKTIQKCDTDLAMYRYNFVKADDEVAYTAKVVRENMGLPAVPIAAGARSSL